MKNITIKPEECVIMPFGGLPEEWENRLYQAELISHEILFEYSAKENALYLSKYGVELFIPYKKTAFPKSTLGELKAMLPHDLEMLISKIRKATPDNPNVKYECSLNIGGDTPRARIIMRAAFNGNEIASLTGKCVNIDEECKRTEALYYAACHDELTGLYRNNHAREKIIDMLKNTDNNYVLGIFDIDHFKKVNDDFGHTVGDKVLISVTQRALKNIRDDGTDVISRVGGDEFVVFIEYENDPDESVQKFFNSLKGDSEGVRYSVSMGVADTRLLGRDYDVLFRCADQALYASKRVGRGVCCFYNIKMQGNIFRTI
ncbi:MAG: GGDEF domain-containing protein [Clostridia bacterium]|nr:GGDEF domain-containing protein [Clostridia bacterium]